ncbi:MAG: lysine decarboxylase [Planctomycetota bacterium]|nr:MAG: lysine decarboxylase [Planctomycetota bacterium]
MTNQERRGPFKAYDNKHFLTAPEARPLRILAEYLEPKTRFEELDVKDTIVVFGSARIRSRKVAEQELAEAQANDGDVKVAERNLTMSKYYEDARELSRRLTEWSKALEGHDRRFVICSGGGPGIMEAANLGASEAKGENIGLNVSLPFEQSGNPYSTHRLTFEFHYFFMRKFWFTYLAKAMIVMPGGFGTLDEFMEVMTLIQTLKIKKHLPVVLFGTEFWSKVLNFDALIEAGTINAGDVDLFLRTDSVDEAYNYLVTELEQHALKDDPELSL